MSNFDQPNFDQPNFDQPSFDQPSFDQPSFSQPSQPSQPNHRGRGRGRRGSWRSRRSLGGHQSSSEPSMQFGDNIENFSAPQQVSTNNNDIYVEEESHSPGVLTLGKRSYYTIDIFGEGGPADDAKCMRMLDNDFSDSGRHVEEVARDVEEPTVQQVPMGSAHDGGANDHLILSNTTTTTGGGGDGGSGIGGGGDDGGGGGGSGIVVGGGSGGGCSGVGGSSGGGGGSGDYHEDYLIVDSSGRKRESFIYVEDHEEEILKVNKRRIHSLGDNAYYCTLCQVILNSIKSLEKHTKSHEHLKKIQLSSTVDVNNPLWCSLCCLVCANAVARDSHINGKMHNKNLTKLKQFKARASCPVGDELDYILKESVLKEGNGLSLGLTSSMMQFLSHNGPFIGLQYAQEIGVEDDPTPEFNCTLCRILCEPGNHQLHFTSLAHRTNVLKKDYPDKMRPLEESTQKDRSRSHFSNELKKIAKEIETAEGRKVEFIRRKILAKPIFSGTKNKKKNKNKQGKQPEKKNKKQANKSPGWKEGGAHGSGSQGGGKHPYGLKSPSVFGEISGHGGYRDEKGGGGGGGGRWKGDSSQGYQTFSYDSPNFIPIPHPRQSTSFGKESVGGATHFGASMHYGMSPGPMSRGNASGIIPYGMAAPYMANPYGMKRTESISYGPGSTLYGLTPSREPNPKAVPLPPPPNPDMIMHQMTIEKLRSETGDRTEAFKALATTMIQTEEDAENAFQLSSALTQALLEYRMKSVSTIVPGGPISALLNIFQKSSESQ